MRVRKRPRRCHKLFEHAYAAAKQILQEHRGQLDRVAAELMKTETLDSAAFNALIKKSEH